MTGDSLDRGESGAGPLAGLRVLQQDPGCQALGEQLGIGAHTRVLLIAGEGPTATGIS